MEDRLRMIEAYLSGDMSEHDRLVFAERLAKESDLQAQVRQYQDSNVLLEQAVSLRLKKQMQQMERPKVKQKLGTATWLRWSALAASVTMLLMAAFWWNNRSANSYDAYFEPYAVVQTLRGGENASSKWQEAYQSKDYQLAKEELLRIKKEEVAWVEAQFYLGNIALIEARPTEARLYFEKVIQVLSPRFLQASEWYLVLAYWGEQDYASARRLADEIMEDEKHPYSRQTNGVTSRLQN